MFLCFQEASIGGGVSLLALPFASDLEDLEPSLAFKWSKRRPEISGQRNKLELKDLLDGHFEGFISCKISKNQKPFFTVYHCLKKSVGKIILSMQNLSFTCVYIQLPLQNALVQYTCMHNCNFGCLRSWTILSRLFRVYQGFT